MCDKLKTPRTLIQVGFKQQCDEGTKKSKEIYLRETREAEWNKKEN